MSSGPPHSELLYADVAGQQSAIAQLARASRAPVHAYLLVGPAHLGFRPLARGFAASLLCPSGGCGRCEVCRRALSGVHPDLVEIERSGANLSVEDAREAVRQAQRRPLEAGRQVIVISDLHLARLSAPVLLKTLEEPPGPTVFVLQADMLTPELATIASRCVQVQLGPVSRDDLVEWLVGQGVDAVPAQTVAEAANGSPQRARLLLDDPDVVARRDLWKGVPGRLDGTGSTAARIAAELLQATEAALAPLERKHQAEIAELAEWAKAYGEKAGSGRKELEDRHKREERRWRTDELRLGLGLLAGTYRDRLVEPAVGGSPEGVGDTAGFGDAASSADAVPAPTSTGGRSSETGGLLAKLASALDHIATLSAELIRNPNETLQLEALLVRLSAVPAPPSLAPSAAAVNASSG